MCGCPAHRDLVDCTGCPCDHAYDRMGQWKQRALAAETERDQLKATLDRVKALAEDMRTWCSPHGIAVLYAQRIEEAIEPPAPVGIEADSEAEFAAQIGAILRKHRAEVHPEHDEACGNCAVIKGAPEVLTAGLGDLPAVREFAAEHDPRKEGDRG